MAFCGVMYSVMAHHGGRHAWDITPSQAEQAAYVCTSLGSKLTTQLIGFKWLNIHLILYGVVICSTKLAVLSLYRRIFSPHRYGAFDISIISLSVILVLFYGSTTFVKIFECRPRAKIFDKKLPGACIDVSSLLNTSGLFNTATDFIILFLPIKAAWQLKMKKQKKIRVILVFTFGLWYNSLTQLLRQASDSKD